MKAALQRLIRSPLAYVLIPWSLAHMSAFIPLHRLRETGTLMAFYHPQPRYPLHILILPKKAIASLLEITDADQQFMMDLFTCVRELVIELKLEEKGYRLIANGGAFQDFPHLHFHLIAE